MMTALTGFAQHFFLCKVCQKHFTGLLARQEAADVESRNDVVMWLWRAHNEARLRLWNCFGGWGWLRQG